MLLIRRSEYVSTKMRFVLARHYHHRRRRHHHHACLYALRIYFVFASLALNMIITALFFLLVVLPFFPLAFSVVWPNLGRKVFAKNSQCNRISCTWCDIITYERIKKEVHKTTGITYNVLRYQRITWDMYNLNRNRCQQTIMLTSILKVKFASQSPVKRNMYCRSWVKSARHVPWDAKEASVDCWSLSW